eukprot:TRINITY_DN2368_c0_g5_i1.p1 TRINITY_DN2368_c0_g5~~TRINITY_DN2368_c0_g5_i1.p1  ORF type:complete len:110 (-),score=5.15 TRINITY_DN2368_c0_g5_i1:250-531(-)
MPQSQRLKKRVRTKRSAITKKKQYNKKKPKPRKNRTIAAKFKQEHNGIMIRNIESLVADRVLQSNERLHSIKPDKKIIEIANKKKEKIQKKRG